MIVLVRKTCFTRIPKNPQFNNNNITETEIVGWRWELCCIGIVDGKCLQGNTSQDEECFLGSRDVCWQGSDQEEKF